MGLFGSESKFESSVKQIPYPQQAVYDNISDLRNLNKVQDRVPEDKVNDFKFDEDTVSLNVAPVGELKLRICDREEPKCVKFETVQSPVPFNLWIQVLPVDEQNSKMKLTLKAELPPFIKGMVEKPMQDAVLVQRMAKAAEEAKHSRKKKKPAVKATVNTAKKATLKVEKPKK